MDFSTFMESVAAIKKLALLPKRHSCSGRHSGVVYQPPKR